MVAKLGKSHHVALLSNFALKVVSRVGKSHNVALALLFCSTFNSLLICLHEEILHAMDFVAAYKDILGPSKI